MQSFGNNRAVQDSKDGLDGLFSANCVKVKNTFIECDEVDELYATEGLKRQVSAPAIYISWESELKFDTVKAETFETIDTPRRAGQESEEEEPDREPDEDLAADENEDNRSKEHEDRPDITCLYPFLQKRSTTRKSFQSPSLPSKKLSDWSNVTTFMIRNIPRTYSQRMLLDEIEQAEFFETFDFFYLPIDLANQSNRGYAFINFLSNDWALQFKSQYDGAFLKAVESTCRINISAAALQGYEANHRHYADTRVNKGDPECRPIFLRASDGTLCISSTRRSSIDGSVIDSKRMSLRHPFPRERQIAVEYMPIHRQSPYGFESVMAAHTLHKEDHPIFCPACGIKVAKVDHLFCQSCGSTLREGRPHQGQILTTCPPQPQPVMMVPQMPPQMPPQMTVPANIPGMMCNYYLVPHH